MAKEGIQRDPIIVDRSTMVVLDGMHRLEALKDLGLTHAVCSLHDYSDESVRLMRWTRTLRNPSNALLRKLKTGLKMGRRLDLDEGLKLLHSGETLSSLAVEDAVFVRDAGGSESSAAEIVRKFDTIVSREHIVTEFVDELSLPQVLGEGDRTFLLTPRLKKRQVIQAAIKSELFPHKTTMHLLDVRPVGVDFPLSGLREPIDQSILNGLLSGREMRIIKPPASHMGRIYADDLLVLR